MKYYAHARAADVMSTQSANGFEWSIKLIGHSYYYVGIASKLEPDTIICFNDQNAITYYSNGNSPIIRIGSRKIHTNLEKQKPGDVIHLEFRPQTKKLVIELVNVRLFSKDSSRKLRTDVTKSICKTMFITFPLFNLKVHLP